jgi:hypothetical protein
VLDAASQRGKLGERSLPAIEKILKESRQLCFLVGGDGQGAEEGVHDHAGVCYTLGRVLAFVVAQAEAEFGSQAVPTVLRATGFASESGANGATADESQARGMRWCFGGEDRIVHPNGAVEGRRVEAARRQGGEGRHGCVGIRLLNARGVEGARVPWGAAREEALDATHEDVERRASVALAKVSCRKASNKTVDAEATHGLVAETEAWENIAAHDEPPASHHLAMLVDSEHSGPERPAGALAAREDAEVVGVFEVLSEHDVANIKQCSKLWDREVPHSPGVLELVRDTSV